MVNTNQFILTTQNYHPDFQAKIKVIDNYNLFYHKNLKLTTGENSIIRLIVIGDFYDYENPKWENQQIADNLLEKHKNFNEVLNATFKYSGEYLIFYYHKLNREFKIFPDTSAQYELYFSINEKNEIIAGSNHRLISMATQLKKDDSPEAIEFYSSQAFLNRRSFIGFDTNFVNLKRLKPNHFLNVNNATVIRFFPNKEKKVSNLEDASRKGAAMVKGFINAAAYRQNLLIPVSAGWDSRLFLAASKEITKNSIYYVFHVKNQSPKYDSTIPEKLFKQLNIPFHIIKKNKLTLKEYEKIEKEYEKDVLFPRPQMYHNIESLNSFRNYLNLNGNISEIVRLEFDEIFFISPKKIAQIEKYPYLNYALIRYKNWFENNKNLFKKYGYRILDMLYWEENCANWVAKSKAEFRAYGIEVFSPFNSRELILTLYGLPKKYRRKQNPIVYKKMIEILWPEVLQVPVNPGPKKVAMRITQYLGIFPIFRNLKLWWNLFKGRNRW